MKLRLVLAALALVTGCQTPEPSPIIVRPVVPVPVSPMERGVGSKHELREEPHRAAVCVARNIDSHRPGLNARIVQGRDPILIEVQVSAAKLVALAQFLLRDDASTAVIWTTPELAQPREELVAVMIQGC